MLFLSFFSFLLIFSTLEDRSGTTVIAITREESNDMETVNARSANISLTKPLVNRIGTKTTTVVIVEAMIAIPTSLVPCMAASIGESPSSLRLNMLSRTTMELSTNIPIPRVSPPRVIRFRFSPKPYIIRRVVNIESGIEAAITSVLVGFFKNTNRMRTASTA